MSHPPLNDDHDLIAALHDLLGPKDEAEQHRRRLALIAENVRLHEENKALTEKMGLMAEAGELHVSPTEGIRQAVGSLLDIVDELCMGFAEGRKQLGFKKGEE